MVADIEGLLQKSLDFGQWSLSLKRNFCCPEEFVVMTEYYAPTYVLFGKGAQNEVGRILKERGIGKVLIHFGGGSVVRSGLLGVVEASLEENGISFVELGGVQPNPRLSLIRKGIALAKEEGVDMVLSVGGGSALDSSKAIAYGVRYDGDVWDLYARHVAPKAVLPVGCVITLAATGSEMSNSSVVTNDEVVPNEKLGCNSNFGRPMVAFMNPELTYTVSPYQTGCGSVDIMMHTLERFFHNGPAFEFTDQGCANVLKTVVKYSKVALENPCDYEARANIMWAGTVSHNGFNNVGYDSIGDWACHKMEHELSAFYDVSHGAGLAAIWGSWARYVASVDYHRFAYLGELVFGLKDDDCKVACEKTIEAFEECFRSMGMPTSLKELGLSLSNDDIVALANAASRGGSERLGSFKVLEEYDIYRIYKAANDR